MAKKLSIFFIVLIVLAVVVGGFFYRIWRQEKFNTDVPEKLKNYTFHEFSGKTIVKNENVGLSFEVPKEWDITKNDNITGTSTDYGIALNSPDMQLDPKLYWIPLPEKGCLINIHVNHHGSRAEWLEKDILATQQGYGYNGEILQINNKNALKTTYGDQEKFQDNPLAFLYVTVEISNDNIVYSFETYILPIDEQKCTQEFNKFLESVFID